MVRDGLTEEILKQLLEGIKLVIHKAIMGYSVPGKGNSKDKGPEVGLYLMCLRNSKEANVARAE